MIAHKCVGMYASCKSCGALLEFDRDDIEYPDEDRPLKETIIPQLLSKIDRNYWTYGEVQCPICGNRERVIHRKYELFPLRDFDFDTEEGRNEWVDSVSLITDRGDDTLGDLISECYACPSGEERFLDNVDFFTEM